MAIVPVTPQSWLFVAPLNLPLQPRLENGRFDSLRPRPLPTAPPCATANVIAGDDPRNPTGHDVYFSTGLHQAVDLETVPGSCVYAAYSGRVVRVETNPAETKGNVSIDHHPRGLGFLTNYNHITGIRVDEGDFVHEGEPFAEVSAEADDPALHFELWAVVDRNGQGREWSPGDSDMVPIDPTRPLYAWEQRLVADEPVAGPLVPVSVGVTRLHSIPLFAATFDSGLTVHVPLYEPVTVDERLTVGLLRDAYRRRTALHLSLRHSSFWGVDVVTQAELA